MASISYHHNKKTGETYVYSVESYWDKEKKAPRNHQVCIGKLDKKTGEVIPSHKKSTIAKRVTNADEITADTRIAGPAMLLDKLADDTGLLSIVKKCFPDNFNEILSLVYFIVQKGLPLSRSEAWSLGHDHPNDASIASQRISELLLKIGENDRQKFLSLWMSNRIPEESAMIEHDYLCYDITSVSSYAMSNEYIKYGHNRDNEPLPQINLALLFGQKSHLPAYYRRMPGNISDVATLRTTMKSMDFLDSKPIHFILDRGFYSKANIDEMFQKKHHFTIAVSSSLKWVEEIIDIHYESIASPENYYQIDDTESLFMSTSLYSWGDNKHRTYLHVYYNARQAADVFDRFTNELLNYKKEVETDKRIKEHEEQYARFLIIKQTPKRGLCVSFNDEAIKKYRKRYAGFFCIFSSTVKDSKEALQIYRAKEVVENSFDDLKNQLDMKRLRIHSSAAMDSRIFLQFLALILICRIRNISKADNILKNLTVREIMEHMETLVRIKFSGRYGQILTEAGPIPRKIMEVFGIHSAT